jgi:serine/threonine-protein kinase TTK/MPS1
MELGSLDLNVFFKKEIQKHQCVREPTRSYYWQKMLEALHAIHAEGVIHSDIKPSNFIVVGCEVKLIDFNISTTMITERTSITMATDCGTLHYMAPETLMRDNDSKTKASKIIQNQFINSFLNCDF